jgi:hypothetical protein
MKADGWLVEEQIAGGRFRRGRALRVDWSRTPWGNTGAGAATTSSCSTATDEEDLQHGPDGQLVNGVVND